METRLSARSPVQTALDRSADFCKMPTWTGLLLTAALYIVGIFDPLGLSSTSVAPWLMLDNRTPTLVGDTDVTRAITEFVVGDQGVRRLFGLVVPFCRERWTTAEIASAP